MTPQTHPVPRPVAMEMYVSLLEAEEYVVEAAQYVHPQEVFLALAVRSNLMSDN
jgi:hypothetical protein